MNINRKEILGFDDKWLMIIGIPLVAIMINGIMFGHIAMSNPSIYFGACHLIAFIYVSAFWLILREGYIRLLNKFPKFALQNKKRLFYTFLIAVISYAIIDLIMHWIIEPMMMDPLEPNPITKIISSFIFVVLILGIYEALHLSVKYQKLSLEREKLVKENINSQLEGLRSQVNPHFLFNSLNTLASLIPEDSEKGVNFVTKLAKVYRYMLESRNEKLIPLHEELEFLHAYNFLLEQRFGDNINVFIEISESQKDKYIIPLSLQIAFENAIKHNIISKEKPLKIEVYIDAEGKLVVRNTLQKKSVLAASTQVGLQNIKNRYSFYTDKTVDIISTSTHFTLVLPLLLEQQPNGISI